MEQGREYGDARKARLPMVAVVAGVGDLQQAEAALVMLADNEPNVVLLDIGIKAENGIEVTKAIVRRCPAIAVLILSAYDNSEFVAQAMQAGARGYVLKDSPSTQVVMAIQSVAAGGTFLSPAIATALFARTASDHELSIREQEILSCLAKGLSSKHIANQLGIGIRTVESHRRGIKRKLNIDGQAQLIKFAVERFAN